MKVTLDADLARFGDEQVRSGRFRTSDEVVNAAVARFKRGDAPPDDLTDEDLAAIEDGLAQLDRGEGIPWEQVRAELRAKLPRP